MKPDTTSNHTIDTQPGIAERAKLHLERSLFRFEMERYLHRVFFGQVHFSKYDRMMTFLPLSIPLPVYFLTYKFTSKTVRVAISLWCTSAAYLAHTYWFSHNTFFRWCREPGILHAYVRRQYILKFGEKDTYSREFIQMDRPYDNYRLQSASTRNFKG